MGKISFAQFTTTIGPGPITQQTSGNVGVGFVGGTPVFQLDVKVPFTTPAENVFNCTVSDATSDFLRITNGTSSAGHFMPIIVGHKANTLTAATGLYICGSISTANDWISTEPVVNFNARRDFPGTNAAVVNRTLFAWTNYNTKYMVMLANGYVGIGTTAPTTPLSVNGKVLIGDPGLASFTGVSSPDYLLFVQKGILAEKVKVAVCTSANWADYVFEKNYNLRTINELESYLIENKHLPNIPSASDVVKDGIDVATMNAKLLEKIEELSLYVIQQNKRIEQLEQASKKN